MSQCELEAFQIMLIDRSQPQISAIFSHLGTRHARRGPCDGDNVSGEHPMAWPLRQRQRVRKIPTAWPRDGDNVFGKSPRRDPSGSDNVSGRSHAIRFAMDGLVLEGSGGGGRIFLDP